MLFFCAVLKYFMVTMFLLHQKCFVITKRTSTHILNRQESRDFGSWGWLLLSPVRRVFCLSCRPSGRSQLPSGQWVKLSGIVGMPYVQPHGRSQVTEPFRVLVGKPTNTEKRLISQQGLLTYPRPTWCPSNWSTDTCWGNWTSRFFLSFNFFSFILKQKKSADYLSPTAVIWNLLHLVLSAM